MRRFSALILPLLLPGVITTGTAIRIWESESESEFSRGGGADRILAQAQCGACHALPESANGLATRSMAPDLIGLESRLDAATLRAFLANPTGLRPRTRMPDLLAGLGDDDRRDALDALPAFLLESGVEESAPAKEWDLEIGEIEKGRQLFHRVGCVACHGAFEQPASLEQPLLQFEDFTAPPEDAQALRRFAPEDIWQDGPPLDRLSGLYDLDGLARFLSDPLQTRPYGLMPNMDLSSSESVALANYLLFEAGVRDGTLESTQTTGLHYAYFEGDFLEEGPPAFDRLQPKREGRIVNLDELPEHRPDQFGFRYTGTLEIPATGQWTFRTTSDDGSWLWIDGDPVVGNGGAHAPQLATGSLHLEAGAHSIELRYFEIGGGEELIVGWQGPGTPDQVIPSIALSSQGLRLVLQEEDAQGTQVNDREALRDRGETWFRNLGCVACHAIEGVEAAPPAPPFASLGAGMEGGLGCLSIQPPSGLPRYPKALLGEKGALRVAARAALDGALLLGQEEQLDSFLSGMSCTACHAREGVGAPASDRRKHFSIQAGVDLGDEGRVPPQLDLAGWKLKQAWLEEVLDTGAKVRPYMLTRMPRFGLDNVGEVVELLAAVDRPTVEVQEPAFTKASLVAAQVLLGTDGLGCVQCHDFAGYGGLGVPAVDLTSSHERLRWPWFRALLADPGSLNMNTRMPSFWTEDGRSPVTEICAGDPVAQVEAMWSGLSLAENMPLPKGLLIPDGTFELTPEDEALLVSVFWRGASARTTLAGFPERMHIAFDVENSRLVSAWRGRFFNARGTWNGRAGALEEPPTDDVLSLPRGAVFAPLVTSDAAWPESQGRAAGWRAAGREFDELRRPTFLYRNRKLGGLLVRERPGPVLEEQGAWLVRTFQLSADEPDRSLWMRAAVADSIEREADGEFVTSSSQRLRVVGSVGLVRQTDRGAELLVGVPWDPEGRAEFRVETIWEKSEENNR